MEVKIGDKLVQEEVNGGFPQVIIEDIDDGKVVIFTDDELLSLHKFLKKVIEIRFKPLKEIVDASSCNEAKTESTNPDPDLQV